MYIHSHPLHTLPPPLHMTINQVNIILSRLNLSHIEYGLKFPPFHFHPNTNRTYLKLTEWFANAIEEDSFYTSLPFDASESGLWNGRFVPPPPRPPFWDDDKVETDGLTTCDLCTWALQDRNAFSIDGTISGEWFFLRRIINNRLLMYSSTFQFENP